MRIASRCWILVLTLGVLARPAAAGDIPENALSASLAMPTILVDSPWLVYRFPQLATRGDSVALAFGRPAIRSELLASVGEHFADFGFASTEMRGLGGVVRSGAVGGFILLQPSYLWKPIRSFGVSYNTNPVLQIGVGGQWGALRIGSALRGTRTTRELGQIQETSTRVALSGEQHELTHREAAFGMGMTLGRISFDAAYELLDESHLEARANVGSDTLAAQIAGDLQDSGAFVLRVGVRLADSMRLVAAGDYGWGRTEWSFLGYQSGQFNSTLRVQGTKTWGTGLALYLPAPHLDLVAVSGSYAHRMTPHAGLASVFDPAYDERRSEQLLGGIAFRTGLWRHLSLLAGVGASWSKLEDNWDLPISPMTVQTSTETVTDSFSWGLAYTWRALEVVGSFRSPPNIDAPTFAIDVHVLP